MTEIKIKNESRSRALIVEDEFLIALDLEAAMSGLGFEICGLAPNGDEARSIAMDHQPDVVLVDVYLGEGATVAKVNNCLRRALFPAAVRRHRWASENRKRRGLNGQAAHESFPTTLRFECNSNT